MKTTTLIRWLSLISLGLLLLILLPQIVKEFSLPGISKQPTKLLELSAEAISAVSIISPNSELTNISKVDNAWQVNTVPADQSAVQMLLEALVDLRIDSVAATNQVNYAQLGIGSNSAQLVTVTSGNTDYAIEVGKPGSTLNTFYAKVTDQDEVYLVNSALLNLLNKPASAYLASGSAAASAAATLTPAQ